MKFRLWKFLSGFQPFQTKFLTNQTFASVPQAEEYAENTVSSIYYLLLEMMGEHYFTRELFSPFLSFRN